jgi:5-formyltetrahydrofolate cyclo-ligase
MTRSDDAVRQTKATLRAALLTQRMRTDPDTIRAASVRIAERVVALPEFGRAGTVLAYLALPQEAQTAGIIECAWLAGKQVAVPAARLDGEYVPVWLKPGDTVAAARFGVPEPVIQMPAKPDRFDLVIVPGVAFTAAGARLGHGKGFYDRLLARLGRRAGCKVGIGLGYQILPGIPVTETDVGMDAVVTEDRLYRSLVAGGMEHG